MFVAESRRGVFVLAAFAGIAASGLATALNSVALSAPRRVKQLPGAGPWHEICAWVEQNDE
jgi:hypothetical protein